MPAEHKIQVTIRLISSGPEGSSDILLKGDAYIKGDTTYLRYQEPPEAEMGRTVTTVRIGRERIRLIRQGDFDSELEFASGQTIGSPYRTPAGIIHLETLTRSMEAVLSGGTGHLEWSYDLLADGAAVGRFRIRLEVARREA